MKKLLIGFLFVFAFIIGAEYNETDVNASSDYNFKIAKSVSWLKNKIALNGALTDRYDNKIYKFTVSKTGKVKVSMNLAPNASYRIILMDSKKRTIESKFTEVGISSKPQELFSIGLGKGSYYVIVEARTGDGNHLIYKVDLDYTFGNFEQEYNDEIQAANKISLNTMYHGFADITADFYRVDLPKNGILSIDINKLPNTQFVVYIQDAKGLDIENRITQNGKDEMIHALSIGLKKGTYYINIQAYDGQITNVPYRIKTFLKVTSSFENEDNDTINKSTSLKVGSTINAYLLNRYDTDYYTFTLKKKLKVIIQTKTNPQNFLSLNLLNSSGTINQMFTTPKGKNKLQTISEVTLLKGTYHIKITRSDGEYYNMRYSLQVK